MLVTLSVNDEAPEFAFHLVEVAEDNVAVSRDYPMRMMYAIKDEPCRLRLLGESNFVNRATAVPLVSGRVQTALTEELSIGRAAVLVVHACYVYLSV